MNQRVFQILVALVGAGFAVMFLVVVVPALVANPDVLGAFAAGFVNPFAAGYATDAIACWLLLAIWVVHEARAHGVRHGWVALVLGVVPGVATGLAVYLLLRLQQLSHAKA